MVSFLAKKGISPILKNLFTGGKQKTTGTEVINKFIKKPRSTKDAKLGELNVATHKLKGQIKRLKDVGDNVKDYMSNK